MKFTIRDLFWLTVVVALGVGWWVNYRSLLWNQSRLEHEQRMSKGLTEDAGRWQQHAVVLVNHLRADGWKVKLEYGSLTVVGPHGEMPNHSAPAPNPPRD